MGGFIFSFLVLFKVGLGVVVFFFALLVAWLVGFEVVVRMVGIGVGFCVIL